MLLECKVLTLLTIKTTITTSHDALITYTFHPMFLNAIGRISTKMMLIHKLELNSCPKILGWDNLPEEVLCELSQPNSMCAYRIVGNLWRIESHQRRPRDRVDALEEKHDGYIGVDQGNRNITRVISIHLGQHSDNHETEDKKDLCQSGSRLAAPPG